MKKKEKIAVVILVAFLLYILFFRTYIKQKQNVVLEFGTFSGSNWDVPNEYSYRVIDSAIQKFEQEHPGVVVHYKSGLLKEDYSEWLSKQILRGKEPDVFMVLEDDFNLFSSIGVLKNLDHMIKKDRTFKKEDFYMPSYQAGKFQKVQYALPYSSVPMLMFVNQTLLKKENLKKPRNDWTWDDFYKICKKVTKDTNGDGRLDQFGCYDYTWKEAVESNGVSLFESNGASANFCDVRVEDAIRYIKRLNALVRQDIATAKDFDTGKVAFRPFSFAEYRAYMPYPWRVKKYSKFSWDVVPLPAGPDGENTTELSTLLVGISARSKKEKLAWKFLKCLTYDEDIQTKLFRYTDGVSVRKDIIRKDEVKKELKKDMPMNSDMNILVLDHVMKNARIVPRFTNYTKAIALANQSIYQMIQEDQNIHSSLKTLQREVNEVLREQ